VLISLNLLKLRSAVLRTAVIKRTFTKPLLHFTAIVAKKCISLAAVAKCIAISYKIDYLQLLQAGSFFTKKQIAMVF